MNLNNMKRILLRAIKREKRKEKMEEKKLMQKRANDAARKRREYYKMKEDPEKWAIYREKHREQMRRYYQKRKAFRGAVLPGDDKFDFESAQSKVNEMLGDD